MPYKTHFAFPHHLPNVQQVDAKYRDGLVRDIEKKLEAGIVKLAALLVSLALPTFALDSKTTLFTLHTKTSTPSKQG